VSEVAGPALLSAVLVGLGFGYAVQRGGLCLTRALANAALFGDRTVLCGYLLAILVAAAATQGLALAGAVELPRAPVRWLASLVGGGLFGTGMMLAGGCAAGTWTRAGEGALGAWVALLGLATGATAASVGALAPLRRALQDPVVEPGGAGPWVTAAALAGLAATLVLSRGLAAPTARRWPWPLAGALVGALAALGRWASGLAGPAVGVGVAGGTAQLLTFPLVGYPGEVTWAMGFVAGIAAGGALAARRAGEFHWRPAPPAALARTLAGGALMGVGASVADGCSVAQTLAGLAALAPGALLASLAMGLGAFATLRLLAGPPPRGTRG